MKTVIKTIVAILMVLTLSNCTKKTNTINNTTTHQASVTHTVMISVTCANFSGYYQINGGANESLVSGNYSPCNTTFTANSGDKITYIYVQTQFQYQNYQILVYEDGKQIYPSSGVYQL